MKYFKNLYRTLALVLVLALAWPLLLPAGNSLMVAQAASLKLSSTKFAIGAGSTKNLSVTGTKSKITWTSNKKDVATVSKTGVVTAKKAGAATITATVNKKKLTCKVTVFETQEVTSCGLTYVIPKEWTTKVLADQGTVQNVAVYPDGADINTGVSYVNVTIQNTGTQAPDYKLVKQTLQASVTKDLIVSQLSQAGLNATLSNFTTGDYNSAIGTAYQISYKAQVTSDSYSGTISQVIYDIYINNYFIQVLVTDVGDGAVPDVNGVGESILNSIQVAE